MENKSKVKTTKPRKARTRATKPATTTKAKTTKKVTKAPAKAKPAVKVTAKKVAVKEVAKKRVLKADLEKEIVVLTKSLNASITKVAKMQKELDLAKDESKFTAELEKSKTTIKRKAKTLREKNVEIKKMTAKITDMAAEYNALVKDAAAFAEKSDKNIAEHRQAFTDMDIAWREAEKKAWNAVQEQVSLTNAAKADANSLQGDIDFLTKELSDCNVTLTANEKEIKEFSVALKEQQEATQSQANANLELRDTHSKAIAELSNRIESKNPMVIVKEWGKAIRAEGAWLPVFLIMLTFIVVAAFAVTGVVSVLPEAYQAWGGFGAGTVAVATMLLFFSDLLGWTENV